MTRHERGLSDPGVDSEMLVTLRLGVQMLALPAVMVREILEPLPVTRVPGSRPFAPAVVNIRGSVMPLVRLEVALGLPQMPVGVDTRFVVLDVTMADEPAQIAIVADAVFEVAPVAVGTDLSALPSAAPWPPGHVNGLFHSARGFVVLPDLPAILSTHLAQVHSTAHPGAVGAS